MDRIDKIRLALILGSTAVAIAMMVILAVSGELWIELIFVMLAMVLFSDMLNMYQKIDVDGTYRRAVYTIAYVLTPILVYGTIGIATIELFIVVGPMVGLSKLSSAMLGLFVAVVVYVAVSYAVYRYREG